VKKQIVLFVGKKYLKMFRSFKRYKENDFEIKTHGFKFPKHASDDQHPSSVANTN